jgi:hypothetical protein
VARHDQLTNAALAAAGLVALMIGTANAEPKTKLPKAFLGEWCFDAKTETRFHS